jgi:hypothetical protein
LRESCKTPELVADIERRRLEWLRHTIRTIRTRVAEDILEGKPEGRRMWESLN